MTVTTTTANYVRNNNVYEKIFYKSFIIFSTLYYNMFTLKKNQIC